MSGGNSLDLAKIFVGGLSWQTNEDSLRYHFEQYGEVASVEVMRDRNTNQPRGFAFVVFKSDETVDLIMSSGPHEINHKIVDVKRAQARGQAPPSIHNVVAASEGAGGAAGGGEAAFAAAMGGGGASGTGGGARPGGGPPTTVSAEQLKCKVFVGGLPLHLDNDGLKGFFSQFGPITDGIVMVDQNTQRSRGFGFITFAVGSGGAQKAIDAQPVDIDGKRVEIKLATPKADQAAGGGGGVAGGRFRPSGGALGLRAGAAAAASRSTGEFAGLAAAYGRNGWRGGYGSYAFGKNGWNVQGWEDSSLVKVERTGFSFDLLGKSRTSAGKSRARSMSGGDRERKRSRHH
eukprot:CAMPEP_0181046540 /NCGR_PEP_ID=MMETSP1070-20121207/14404_1 /TAXON_ID=265543 /ORGANISM="Minutocellus polymorphus, Strain NH13" /LENGTH=345 /DNA_ID=CAMNT_0023125159 /DNA_START=99 /DNA_END=1136 /DNA_ORIENTATION=-